MMKVSRVFLQAVILESAVLLSAIACGGGGGAQQHEQPPAPQLSSISVAPNNLTLTLGVNQVFTATGQYTDGSAKNVTASVQWSSSDTDVIWLNNATSRRGIGTPRGTGNSTVKATLNGITGSASITVSALFARYGYVAHQDDGTLSRFVLDTNVGVIRAKEYAYLGATTPIAAATDPTGHFIFLLDAASDSLWAYSINAESGKLSSISGSPFKCGSGSRSLAIDPQGKYVYVANQNGGNVSVYSVAAGTGVLNGVTGSPFPAGAGTSALTVDPTGRFLYTANSVDNNVTAFLIGDTGNLTSVSGSPFSAGQRPTSLVVDMTGQYLYTVNAGANTVSAFSIDSITGALKPLAGASYSTGDNPISLVFEPGGQYLYVANRGNASNNFSGSISAFALSPDNGSLTTISSTSAGIDPRAIFADPSGRTIYLVNHGSHDIWSFNINRQNGALSFTQTARTRTGPASVAITTGKDPVVVSPTFAYAVGAGASAVGAYSIDPVTGALSEIAGSPFGTAGASISAATHPSGRFLYVGNYWSYKVSGFSIDSNSGVLTPVPGSPYSFPSVNSGPFMVLPEPSGRFLYMTNSYDVLHAMAIDPVTGALAPVPWGPVKITESSPWGPSGFVIDPAGRFLYVVNSSMVNVSEFQINPVDGSLTEVPGSPLSLDLQGNWLQSVGIDPSGKYLYIPVRCSSWSTNCTDHALFGFVIDANDGHLIPVQGSPWKTAVTDFPSLAIDADGRFLYASDGGQGLAETTGTYGFAIDPVTGALSNIVGSPYPPTGYTFLNTDPTGNFLYGGHENGLRVYKIDQTTGTLSVSQDLPFTAGGSVWSITINSVTK